MQELESRKCWVSRKTNSNVVSMTSKGLLVLLLLATEPFFRNLISDPELFFALLLGFHGVP